MTPDALQALIAAGPAPPGLVLHVGAGLAPPFAAGVPEGARLVLVEADPDRAALLAERHEGQAGVTVRAAAVAPRAGPAVLQRLVPGEFSSLRRPRRLAEIYPGLGPPEEVPVDGVALSDLLAELLAELAPDIAPDTAPGDASGNWLILDAPGLETGLVAALADCPGRAAFGHVLVRAARVPLYEGSVFDPDAFGLADLELVDARRDAEPEWLWYLARRKAAPDARPGTDPEEVAALRRDLRVALRSQALAEDDLRDLRARYATVLDERTRQEALIGKLAQRLGEASDWLRRLGPPDEVEGTPSQTLPKQGRKSRKGRRKDTA